MKLSFKSPFSVAIAMSFGLVVLMGYFFGTDAAGNPTLLGILRDYFLKGAVIMAAVALFVGIGNLTTVHMGKIQKGEQAGYSFVLLISMVFTIGIGLFDMFQVYFLGKPNFEWTQWVFDNIQMPIVTSLMAVFAITLTYAAARLLGRRTTLFSAVFFGIVLLLLIGTVPQFIARFDLLGDIKAWIVGVFAVGGGRGILLGVALGTIATGIRILTGGDRPYRG